MGRTGRLFAYEHFGIEPDIMTLAKGLGGGVPIGAMLAKENIASSFTPGSHASTFGGNPLVCQAAVATLETILEDNAFILKECSRLGAYLKDRLYKLKEEFSGIIVDIRGIGLMVGVELTRECQPIVKACIEKGLLINCTAGTTLRFTPPLIITEEDIDAALDILADILWRLS